MFHSLFRRTAILTALVLLSAIAFPAAAQDPGPDYADCEAVNATSILITWSDDPLAQSYRVYRSGPGMIAEVPGDVNEYLDTGLTAGIPYYYGVASVVSGEEYWMNHPDIGAMPLDPVGGITSLSWRKVTDSNTSSGFRLEIDLAWTPVGLLTGYEIHARIGDSGEYWHFQNAQNAQQTTASISFTLPTVQTRYWFKVRVFYEGYYVPEYDYYMYRTGPFSPEASISVPAYANLQFKTLKPLITIKPTLHTIRMPKPTLLPLRTLRPTVLVRVTPTPKFQQPVRTILIIPRPMPTPKLLQPVRTSIVIIPRATPTPAPVFRIRH